MNELLKALRIQPIGNANIARVWCFFAVASYISPDANAP